MIVWTPHLFSIAYDSLLYAFSHFCPQIWSKSERSVEPQQNLTRFSPSIYSKEPLLSGQLAQSRGWPLNGGLTVVQAVSLRKEIERTTWSSLKNAETVLNVSLIAPLAVGDARSTANGEPARRPSTVAFFETATTMSLLICWAVGGPAKCNLSNMEWSVTVINGKNEEFQLESQSRKTNNKQFHRGVGVWWYSYDDFQPMRVRTRFLFLVASQPKSLGHFFSLGKTAGTMCCQLARRSPGLLVRRWRSLSDLLVTSLYYRRVFWANFVPRLFHVSEQVHDSVRRIRIVSSQSVWEVPVSAIRSGTLNLAESPSVCDCAVTGARGFIDTSSAWEVRRNVAFPP